MPLGGLDRAGRQAGSDTEHRIPGSKRCGYRRGFQSHGMKSAGDPTLAGVADALRVQVRVIWLDVPNRGRRTPTTRNRHRTAARLSQGCTPPGKQQLMETIAISSSSATSRSTAATTARRHDLSAQLARKHGRGRVVGESGVRGGFSPLAAALVVAQLDSGQRGRSPAQRRPARLRRLVPYAWPGRPRRRCTPAPAPALLLGLQHFQRNCCAKTTAPAPSASASRPCPG